MGRNEVNLLHRTLHIFVESLLFLILCVASLRHGIRWCIRVPAILLTMMPLLCRPLGMCAQTSSAQRPLARRFIRPTHLRKAAHAQACARRPICAKMPTRKLAPAAPSAQRCPRASLRPPPHLHKCAQAQTEVTSALKKCATKKCQQLQNARAATRERFANK